MPATSDPWFWAMLGSVLLHHSIFFAMALATAGCTSFGSREFHLYRSDDSSSSASGARELAVFHFGDEDDLNAPQMSLNKVNRGYAMHANLDRNDTMRDDIIIRRDHESKWFAGYQWKFEF